MKKLYVVDLEHSVYVMAESEEDAEQTAIRGIREYGDTPRVTASEARSGPIPRDWRNSIPFGSDDDRTVEDLIKS